ncbi:MAG: DNA mismatch repair protein MutS [Chlamydiae bacterium]|nr:DNA mismatch repair protein MutS [Chlamydiota bacterium]
MTTIAQTPMMTQWQACKEAAPNALLFFRLGDFYEAFYTDAEVMAKELGITLTKRQGTPMAGVPHHMCEVYTDRLVAKGHRVAIAEQMEDPKQVKGIVKRKVVRIVTPGTVINSSLIKDKEQSFLASIIQVNKLWGLSYLDITTADFFVVEFENEEALLDEISRVSPKELLLSKKWKESPPLFLEELLRTIRPTVHYLENWHFDHKSALDLLHSHFKVETLDGFGLKGMISGINAAGSLLSHVKEDLHLPTGHITLLRTQTKEGVMQIDTSTQKNLELIRPLHEGQKESTLLHLIDQTETPMGGRLLRKWLLNPLLSAEQIANRQDKVELFSRDFSALLQLRRALSEVRDLERLMMRIETGFASPRDLAALRFSLEQTPMISEALLSFTREAEPLPDVSLLVDRVAKTLVDAPPMRLSDGGLFKEGTDNELDQFLTIKRDSKVWTAAYQTKLRETLGIKTIKVGYTRAFGYYIEVSKGQCDKVPEHFHRRQTLVNAERFVTEELKNFEYKILSADERISALEAKLFKELVGYVSEFAPTVRTIARKVAQIDCFTALAKVALEREYIRPVVDESSLFMVTGGRHPVIEAQDGVDFIPNDLSFDGTKRQLALITGPNMAGKSTFIRQAALIAILAQIGSFIPAEKAHIGVIDKVFSRIGASDDLARGQSTFMVEMTETANILHNATDRSLVILDEIGRGTSTYDGVSIAWAVAVHLLTETGRQAKTLFATHYFEMTELSEIYPRAYNLNVAVEESDEGITFLRKIVEGCADKSYGIHVARLAGLPQSVLKAAEEKLHQLEKIEGTKPIKKQTSQPDFFSAPPPIKEHPLVRELETLDPNALTPIDALQLIAKWKEKGDAL